MNEITSEEQDAQIFFMTRKISIIFLLLLTVVVSVMAQSSQQAKLLKKAYRLHSTQMLYDFFDNWSEEV